jgi:hypothetical protein
MTGGPSSSGAPQVVAHDLKQVEAIEAGMHDVKMQAPAESGRGGAADRRVEGPERGLQKHVSE